MERQEVPPQISLLQLPADSHTQASSTTASNGLKISIPCSTNTVVPYVPNNTSGTTFFANLPSSNFHPTLLGSKFSTTTIAAVFSLPPTYPFRRYAITPPSPPVSISKPPYTTMSQNSLRNVSSRAQ